MNDIFDCCCKRQKCKDPLIEPLVSMIEEKRKPYSLSDIIINKSVSWSDNNNNKSALDEFNYLLKKMKSIKK